MSYDVDAGPPRSVELQREIEDVLARVRDELTNDRLVALGVVALLGYAVATGDASRTATSTTSWAETVTLADVVRWTGIVVAITLGSMVVITLHELCHWLAFQRLRINAYWSLTWFSVGEYNVYPAGGICWPRHIMANARMSWLEDAFVSLAPLALTAVALVLAGVYHLVVAPITAPGWVVLGILVMTGPSPPDYGRLLETPRERWEFLLDVEDAIANHGAAEGSR